MTMSPTLAGTELGDVTGTVTDNVVGAPPRHHVPMSAIAGVGTAVSGEPYSQKDLLEIFRITDPKVRSVFLNSAIERRFLSWHISYRRAT